MNSPTTHSGSNSEQIVIDWTKALQDESIQADIDGMIEWVRTYPRRRDIHVYLGAGRHRAHGRKLQNALQALGCVVTNRCFTVA